MGPEPQFIVSFRGAEVGRYETAERALTAARSVIDNEVGAQLGRGELTPQSIPAEQPRIEWQPPRVPFPFDAVGYWHWRAQVVSSDRRPPTTGARPLPPSPPVPPRGRDQYRPTGPATVYDAPPPRPEPVPTVITPVHDLPQRSQEGPIAPAHTGPPPSDSTEEYEPGRRWSGEGNS